MDCRTVAQCIGVTPGPLCDAGTYACSLSLSLSFCPPTVAVICSLASRESERTKDRGGRGVHRRKNLFVLNSLLSAQWVYVFQLASDDESESVAGSRRPAHGISPPFRLAPSRVSAAYFFRLFFPAPTTDTARHSHLFSGLSRGHRSGRSMPSCDNLSLVSMSARE